MSESVSKSESGSGSGSWSERVQWPSLTSRCPVAMPALSMCAGYVYVVALFPARACTHTHTHPARARAVFPSAPSRQPSPSLATSSSPSHHPWSLPTRAGCPVLTGCPLPTGCPSGATKPPQNRARAVIQATPDGLHGNDDTEAVWSGSARLCQPGPRRRATRHVGIERRTVGSPRLDERQPH